MPIRTRTWIRVRSTGMPPGRLRVAAHRLDAITEAGVVKQDVQDDRQDDEQDRDHRDEPEDLDVEEREEAPGLVRTTARDSFTTSDRPR